MHDTTLGWRLINPRMAELGVSTESMGETGENVAERYGITREDQDAFAPAQPPARGRRRRGGRLRRGDRPGRGAARAARRSLVDADEGPRARRLAGEAGEAAPGLPRGRHGHRRQRLDPQRRRRLPADRLRGGRRGARRRAARPASSPSASPASTPPTWASARSRPIPRALAAAGLDARPDRPDRAQRGLRLPGPRLRPRARHRRGAPQRQRRRDRPRPPARLLRRPPHRHPRPRAAPPRRQVRHRDPVRRRRPGPGDGLRSV